jgi:hypothetical protein
MMDKIRPYLTKIGVIVALGLLGLIAATLFINNRLTAGSVPSQALAAAQSEFAISGNVDRLTQVADEHPGTTAAMWALQTSGDYQLRLGIDTLREDREGGFELVQKSKELFQQVMDAPAGIKTPLIQQASLFSMAYASEALGEFENAAKYYQQLTEEAPKSHFATAAARGAARASNPAFVAAYEKFKNFEAIGDAPGPNVPERPEIDFPEFELPRGGESAKEAAKPAEEAAASASEEPAMPATEEAAPADESTELATEAATTETPATETVENTEAAVGESPASNDEAAE